MRLVLLLLLALAFVQAGCEPVPETDELRQYEDSILQAMAPPRENDYALTLRGTVEDTLSGRATFGSVVDGATGKTMVLIRLETGLDFGGGFFVAYPGTQLPPAGTYPITVFPEDSVRTAQPLQGFAVGYRRGLLINMRSTEGTITLEEVSDTLVRARFSADLEGTIARPGGRATPGVLSATGEFRARPLGAGFVLGL